MAYNGWYPLSAKKEYFHYKYCGKLYNAWWSIRVGSLEIKSVRICGEHGKPCPECRSAKKGK